MTDLPKTSVPAQRALELVGVRSLEELALWREVEVAALHGVGPKALRIWRAAMDDLGLGFVR
ncbi:hypothetical protein GCM10027589_14970 [Actinocorallia lasiicapitis]